MSGRKYFREDTYAPQGGTENSPGPLKNSSLSGFGIYKERNKKGYEKAYLGVNRLQTPIPIKPAPEISFIVFAETNLSSSEPTITARKVAMVNAHEAAARIPQIKGKGHFLGLENLKN